MALLTVGVLVEERYLAQSQPRALITALRARSHQVRVIDPHQLLHRAGDEAWLRGLDVIVARGRSWDLFALLSAAESAGIPTVNRRAAIAAVHNKAEMTVRLAAAGLPTPRTWIGTAAFLAAAVSADEFPLILKPIFGDNCRGVEVFCSAAQLRAVQHSDVMIAQHFLQNDGFDVKLYAVGSDVWAIRKPSPLIAGPSPEPEPIPVTRHAREIARRCGTSFGLSLFGVDCIESRGALSVIEVNEYPNYSGVPEAGDRIAAHVERLLEMEWSAVAS